MRIERPVIVAEWFDLKDDKRRCLLRAAVPIGGRTVPVLDVVFPRKARGTPAAEKHFLSRLESMVPQAVRPLLVTDAGFRSPWFQTVSQRGWHWVGQLRHTTLVKPVDVPDRNEERVPSRALHVLA